MNSLRIIIVNVLFVLATSFSFAQTNVSGAYFANTNWSLSGSPYNVTGDVQIPAGVTFSIEPGVQINFSGDYQILVKGMMIANGTAAAPITFKGTSSGRAMLLFRSTNLTNSQMSYVKFIGPKDAFQLEDESEFSQSATKMTGVLNVNTVELTNTTVKTKGYATTASLVINNATVLSSLVKGVYPRSEPITLNNSNISNSTINSDAYNAGITLKNSSATNTHFPIGCCGANINIISSTISSSFFEAGMGSPVDGPLKISGSSLINTTVLLPSARVEITGSTITYDNLFNGLVFGYGEINSSTITGNGAGKAVIVGSYGYNSTGATLIKNTTIKNAEIALTINGSSSCVVDSSFFENNTKYNIQNLSPTSITAKNNWWGTTNSNEISYKIYDYFDNINSGIVDFSNSGTSNSFSIVLQQNAGGTVKQSNVTLANGSTVTAQAGSTKIFTITPNAGYEIATLSFKGTDVKSQLISSQYTTPVINSNGTLSVTFNKIQYRLSVKAGDSGAFSLLCDYGSTPSFDISAPDGMKIISVSFNGANVINSVANGIYTVPSITENSSLIVTYGAISTQLNEASGANIKVYAAKSKIIIEGSEKGESIKLFTLLGKQLVQIQSEGEKIEIPVQESAVYIVKTATKTFKIVL